MHLADVTGEMLFQRNNQNFFHIVKAQMRNWVTERLRDLPRVIQEDCVSAGN